MPRRKKRIFTRSSRCCRGVGVLGELLGLYISYRWFHQPDLRIYPAELGGIHLTNMWMNGEMLYPTNVENKMVSTMVKSPQAHELMVCLCVADYWYGLDWECYKSFKSFEWIGSVAQQCPVTLAFIPEITGKSGGIFRKHLFSLLKTPWCQAEIARRKRLTPRVIPPIHKGQSQRPGLSFWDGNDMKVQDVSRTHPQWDPIGVRFMVGIDGLPSGKHSCWKLPFIVDFPIKNGGSFHSCVKLPEGKHHNRNQTLFSAACQWHRGSARASSMAPTVPTAPTVPMEVPPLWEPWDAEFSPWLNGQQFTIYPRYLQMLACFEYTMNCC